MLTNFNIIMRFFIH